MKLMLLSQSLLHVTLNICSELYQAQRWYTESIYWTPMIVRNGCHIFIGDIVDIAIDVFVNSGKVVKFYRKV